jgi:hypothetical protein
MGMIRAQKTLFWLNDDAATEEFRVAIKAYKPFW